MSAPLPLPRRPHLPGSGSAPDREPLERAKALVPPAFPDGVPADDAAFRYGLRLHEAGFFWEAHEVWEAVWKAAPKNGRDRLILRGLIQLANAQLKLKMGRPAAALRLLDEAAEEFAESATRGASDRGLMAGMQIERFLRELQAARHAMEGRRGAQSA